MAPRDDTPLPPPRPPSLDLGPYMNALAAKRRRALWPWTIVLVTTVIAWAAVARLRSIDRKAQRALAEARGEAAEHRAARFAAEAEVKRLADENLRLRQALDQATKPPPSGP